MQVQRLPRTGDGIKVIITADDGSVHRLIIFEDHGDGGAKGEALAVDLVKQRVARKQVV